MQLLWLTYFMTVARYQSISKAAKEYGIPTPAMSATIKRLESELGTTLFYRTKNRLSLNEKGQQFNRYVVRALGLIADGVDAVSEDASSPAGNVRILLLDNRNFVMNHVFESAQKYPGIKFSIVHNYTNPKEYDCDICVSAHSYHPHFNAHLPLVEDTLCVAVSAEHPLAGRDSVRFDDLASERFMVLPFTSSLTQFALEACRRSGFEPNIVITCDDWHCIVQYVDMGLGITFAPSNPWNGFQSERYSILPIEGAEGCRTTFVFWNDDKYMSLAVRTFLWELRQARMQAI